MGPFSLADTEGRKLPASIAAFAALPACYHYLLSTSKKDHSPRDTRFYQSDCFIVTVLPVGVAVTNVAAFLQNDSSEWFPNIAVCAMCHAMV